MLPGRSLFQEDTKSNDQQLPEFIVVEDDPLVLMDIRDMLMREFNALPLGLETVRHLDELLAVVGRPAVIIAGCSLDGFLGAIQDAVRQKLPLVAVLIAEKPEGAAELPIDLTFVPEPFSSEFMLEAVKSACVRLQSIPS